RAFAKLKYVYCGGSVAGASKLADLSPLQGMKLLKLNLGGSKVANLGPLQGMPLMYINCGGTVVSDLSPLAGMSLNTLICNHTQVSDLSALPGMPLVHLQCIGTQVSDISPLHDCKGLKTLDVTKTKVTAAGVTALQKALPGCKIEWDSPVTPRPVTGGNALAF